MHRCRVRWTTWWSRCVTSGDAVASAVTGPIAFVALGANLGDPAAALAAAVVALGRLGQIDGASDLWATDPVGGPAGQRTYLNAVIGWRPAPAWSTPERALAALLAIESGLGRVRREPWGPRRIDLDLLDWRGGRSRAHGSRLRRPALPHPRAHERAFVLVPWSEVAPDWATGPVAPDGGRPPHAAFTRPRVADSARACDRTGVRLADPQARELWHAAAGPAPRRATFG